MAAAIDLPLRADDLRNRRRRERFVDDTVAMQTGAAAAAAPYLEYKRRGPDVQRVNLAMVRRCVASAARQLPVAFIQVTLATLLDGVLNRLAPAYAATGVTRVFVRVRGLDAERASSREFSPARARAPTQTRRTARPSRVTAETKKTRAVIAPDGLAQPQSKRPRSTSNRPNANGRHWPPRIKPKPLRRRGPVLAPHGTGSTCRSTRFR
jgi:hypothetical protein